MRVIYLEKKKMKILPPEVIRDIYFWLLKFNYTARTLLNEIVLIDSFGTQWIFDGYLWAGR
jgi:hypothetical protein